MGGYRLKRKRIPGFSAEDMTGLRFGPWKIIAPWGTQSGCNWCWIVQCQHCGTLNKRQGCHMRHGRQLRCPACGHNKRPRRKVLWIEPPTQDEIAALNPTYRVPLHLVIHSSVPFDDLNRYNYDVTKQLARRLTQILNEWPATGDDSPRQFDVDEAFSDWREDLNQKDPDMQAVAQIDV